MLFQLKPEFRKFLQFPKTMCVERVVSFKHVKYLKEKPSPNDIKSVDSAALKTT